MFNQTTIGIKCVMEEGNEWRELCEMTGFKIIYDDLVDLLYSCFDTTQTVEKQCFNIQFIIVKTIVVILSTRIIMTYVQMLFMFALGIE
jgi:hypothetical protein